MTPTDRDASIPDGYRRCTNLPQFRVHVECAAVCDSDAESIEAHNQWHKRLEETAWQAEAAQDRWEADQ